MPLGSGTGEPNNLELGIGESFFDDYANQVIEQWEAQSAKATLPGNLVVQSGYTASKGNHLITVKVHNPISCLGLSSRSAPH